MTTLPNCFGKSWEAKHPECAGGLDHGYSNPNDGSHLRERCRWYSQCASKTTANRVGNTIPAHQLVRHQQQPPQQAPPNPLSMFHTFVNSASRGMSKVSQTHPAVNATKQPQAVQQTPMMQPYYGHPTPVMVHPAMASAPWAVPMNYQTPGAQIPGYLTVPEPAVVGQHWAARLGLSLLRSVLKAGGHTVANFFDHTSFNSWQAPPPPEPPAGSVPPNSST